MSPSPGRDASLRRPLVGVAVLLLGVAIGSAAFTFDYAEGDSYLTDDPGACANCHVMGSHFDAWERSSHRSVAVCNDCHAPHGNLVAKYAVKAINGFNHSWAFTTGDYPDALRITSLNRGVTESACRSCHAPVVAAVDDGHAGDEGISCIRCHGAVGHPR